MKKRVFALLMLVVIFALVGCGDASTKSTGSSNVNSVSDVLEQQMNAGEAAPDVSAPETKAAAAPRAQTVSSQPIDIDLTAMNSTMVYSQVYDMLVEPEAYLGEVVKMDGQFVLYQCYDENGEVVGDQLYYACIIQDATACCAQGLEFIPAGDFRYPEDFPEIGGRISVVGEFQTYMEGDTQYCHLINAQMVAG